MKIKKNFLLEKLVSKDENRPLLHHIYVGEGKAVATNGIAAAVVPIEMEVDDLPGLITAEQLTYGRKRSAIREGGSKQKTHIHMTANNQIAFRNGWKSERPIIEKPFPNVNEVFPDKDGDKPVHSVTLNAKLLFDLAQAMGTEEIRLSFYENESAAVLVTTKAGCRGAIMPLK